MGDVRKFDLQYFGVESEDGKEPKGKKDAQPQDNQPEGGKKDEDKKDKKSEPVFTQEQLDAIIKDRLERERKKYADYEELKQKLQEYEEEKKRKEREKMSELERLQADLQEKDELLKDYQKQLEELRRVRKQDAIERAFERYARKAEIEYIEDAFKLADISNVEVDEDGNVKGMEEVVKNLVESKPFLVKQKKGEQKQIGGASNPQPKQGKSDKERLKELAEKARRTGRMEDKLAYLRAKREIEGY